MKYAWLILLISGTFAHAADVHGNGPRESNMTFLKAICREATVFREPILKKPDEPNAKTLDQVCVEKFSELAQKNGSLYSLAVQVCYRYSLKEVDTNIQFNPGCWDRAVAWIDDDKLNNKLKEQPCKANHDPKDSELTRLDEIDRVRNCYRDAFQEVQRARGEGSGGDKKNPSTSGT